MRGLLRFTSVVAVLGLIGCTGELIPLDPQPPVGADAGVNPGADAGGGDPVARAFYDDNVAPLFVVTRPLGACIACHQNVDPIDGPDFLGTAPLQSYDLLVANTRLISDNPATSLLVVKGLHTGDAFAPAELSTINQWIMLEAAQ